MASPKIPRLNLTFASTDKPTSPSNLAPLPSSRPSILFATISQDTEGLSKIIGALQDFDALLTQLKGKKHHDDSSSPNWRPSRLLLASDLQNLRQQINSFMEESRQAVGGLSTAREVLKKSPRVPHHFNLSSSSGMSSARTPAAASATSAALGDMERLRAIRPSEADAIPMTRAGLRHYQSIFASLASEFKSICAKLPPMDGERQDATNGTGDDSEGDSNDGTEAGDDVASVDIERLEAKFNKLQELASLLNDRLAAYSPPPSDRPNGGPAAAGGAGRRSKDLSSSGSSANDGESDYSFPTPPEPPSPHAADEDQDQERMDIIIDNDSFSPSHSDNTGVRHVRACLVVPGRGHTDPGLPFRQRRSVGSVVEVHEQEQEHENDARREKKRMEGTAHAVGVGGQEAVRQKGERRKGALARRERGRGSGRGRGQKRHKGVIELLVRVTAQWLERSRVRD
ncbi:unnamed protein product [Vitrella brassicaformis CCMP3155]|uniref:Uncharacterized protein n=1 Tax=Vitrella brassicaformis (strain CCMP3155) TaxID=1169540 RepID=A0A0G4EXR2_VITBC|nr:unnamed protein product [Vitrella brassicaformis CCMP3155]|eukprot:CEM03506.1 unnamed protein product [Vitrella brassicaformis CCMP3155]